MGRGGVIGFHGQPPADLHRPSPSPNRALQRDHRVHGAGLGRAVHALGDGSQATGHGDALQHIGAHAMHCSHPQDTEQEAKDSKGALHDLRNTRRSHAYR
jgi:hypothetical protein